MKQIVCIIISVVIFSCKNDNNSTKIIFEEHFTDQILNESNWNYELGNGCPDICGWGNNEKQIYTKKNVKISNGNLVITVSKDDEKYYSSRITTKDKVEFQYGTVEVRAKLPTGQGIWPAIWMLGHDTDTKRWPACGEIDIMEYVGRKPHEIHTTLHTSDSYGNSKNTKITVNKNIENGFHIYKTNWTENKIKFFIDDELVYTFSPEVKNEKTWPYNKPFFMILNVAVGGNFGGQDIDDAIFPQEFIIDYIKILKN